MLYPISSTSILYILFSSTTMLFPTLNWLLQLPLEEFILDTIKKVSFAEQQVIMWPIEGKSLLINTTRKYFALFCGIKAHDTSKQKDKGNNIFFIF